MGATTTSTNNQQRTDFEREIIFLRDNKYESAEFTNDTYNPITMEAGRVIGRVSATFEIAPQASGNVDGSARPIGVLTQTTVVEAGDTVSLNFCIGGEVAKEKVILDGGDTFETLVSGITINDLLNNFVTLVSGTEMTAFDN
jgi:hypothetical protein